MPQSSSHFSSNPGLNITPMPMPTMPGSPLAAIPSFDNKGIDPAQASLNRLQQLIGFLDSTLRLPSTPRAFMVYLLGLAIVFTGAFLHVLVAAQIMQAEFTLSKLQEEYRAIEQQNGDIIFRIARDSNMARLHERVVAQGYGPAETREYLFVPNKAIARSTGETTDETTDATVAVAQSSAQVEAAPAVEPTAASQAAQPTTANLGGQFARWEEFWTNTLRSATGAVTAAPAVPASTKQGIVARSVQPPANFWSVWWEEATKQGSQLLERFRSQ